MNGQMKVKSLSLSRRTQTPPRKEESVKPIVTEDNKTQISSLEAALNSPIARPSRLCSTPIRKNVELIEDSPDQDYQGSPTSLYPCTQESNEIAWDWQHCAVDQSSDSTGAEKTTKTNSTGLNRTPKRPQQLLKKKRTAKSYSPLLNVPNKRKLVNSEVAESIGKFAAELQALAEKIRTDQNSEANEKKNGGEIRQEITAGTSKQLSINDMETQNVFDIHEATTLEVSYIAEEKTDPEKLESSLDDLFDDSVDACMVQCSQEIEDKLKFNSGGKGDSSNEARGRTPDCGASTNSCNQNMGTKPSCTVNIETRYQGGDRKEVTSSDSKLRDFKNSSKQAGSCEKLWKENDIPASQIPDDSFDDCLALCLEDDDDFARKFLENEKPANTSRKVKDPVTNISNSSNHDEPIFNQKNQTVNLSLLFNRNQPGTALATPENRKYLKAKSLSDSYCANSGLGKNGKFNLKQNSNLGKSYAPPPMTKSTSNFNLSQKTRTNEIQNQVFPTKNSNNCIPAAGGRSNSANNLSNKQPSSTTVSYSYLRKSSDNLSTNTSNKWTSDPYSRAAELGEKSLKELRTTVPSCSQQQQYNAQEIERKRLEAKMRLEANRLKKINSSKSNGGISLQNKRPEVKR